MFLHDLTSHPTVIKVKHIHLIAGHSTLTSACIGAGYTSIQTRFAT